MYINMIYIIVHIYTHLLYICILLYINSVKNCKMGKSPRCELFYFGPSTTKVQCAEQERKALFLPYYMAGIWNVGSIRRKIQQTLLRNTEHIRSSILNLSAPFQMLFFTPMLHGLLANTVIFWLMRMTTTLIRLESNQQKERLFLSKSVTHCFTQRDLFLQEQGIMKRKNKELMTKQAEVLGSVALLP